jgi:hypothetical protein
MTNQRIYRRTRFSAGVLREASRVFRTFADRLREKYRTHYVIGATSGEMWSHDNVEEFYAEYMRSDGQQDAAFVEKTDNWSCELSVHCIDGDTIVSNRRPSSGLRHSE